MSLFKFKVSYRNDDKLPYSCDDLALALHYLYQQNQKKVYVSEPIMTQLDVVNNIFEEDAEPVLEKKFDGEYIAAFKDQEMDKLKYEVNEMK
jgi:hypothetical protein